MIAIRYTFKVNERLKKEQQINTLFHTGKAFSVFPLRIIYTLVPCTDPAEPPAKAGFSVPKKKVKLSVGRHRIRRLMLEAWRLNKHTVFAAVPEGKQLHLFVMYTDKAEPTYDKVCATLLKCTSRLLAALTAADQPQPQPEMPQNTPQ